MKPVLVLQNLSGDGPGHLGRWLQRHGIVADVRNVQVGDALPGHLRDHAALALLGGEMSANDALPHLRQAEALVREAMAAGQPVIGHCLGGQLMARALGQRVGPSPLPEVGWQPITIEPVPLAREWFGDLRCATVFQWHFEAFGLPPEATRLAGSPGCPQQAFALGPHLAMQFHIEVDADKVTRWAAEDGSRWREARAASPGSVQDAEALRAGLAQHLAAHQALADRLYAHWWQGVPR